MTPAERGVGVQQDYLRTLSAGLAMPRRARELIVAEIADGLACATRAHVDRGSEPVEAARQAVAEFGDPRRLAAGFVVQHIAVTGHRIGLGLVVTGPVVGGLWLAALGAGITTKSLVPLILAVTVPAAVVAIAGAGPLARRIPVPASIVGRAALLATAGCLMGDLTLVTVAVTGSPAGWTGPLAIAVAASVVRASATSVAMRRIGRLRAAVPTR